LKEIKLTKQHNIINEQYINSHDLPV